MKKMEIFFRINKENNESGDVKRPHCPHCNNPLVIERDSVMDECFMVGGPNRTEYREVVSEVYCSHCKTSFHKSILYQCE